MGKIKSTKWKLDPHTEAKHVILKKYLLAWFPIITRYSDRVVVVDGFAGPGEYEKGQDGSPIIAIKAFVEHQSKMDAEVKFFFIEKEENRCKCLRKKLSTLKIPKNVECHVECAEFSDVVTKTLDSIESKGQRLAPSFFFIDPFGYTDMPMALIKRIASHEKSEVFITFMYEEINRFIAVDEQAQNYDELFGTDEWREVRKITSSTERMKALHNIYKEQLEKVAKIKYVRYFKMINKSNKADYFLFFGTNNIKGLKHMKEAMWKADECGDYQFSDATYNPDQLMLFEPEPNYELLKRMIIKEHQGKTVPVEELENYVLISTSFLDTHYKTKILRPMEEKEEIRVHGTRSRKGTYPNGKGVQIEFL